MMFMKPCPDIGISVLSSPIITVGGCFVEKYDMDSKRCFDDVMCADAPLSMTILVRDCGNDGLIDWGFVGAVANGFDDLLVVM